MTAYFKLTRATLLSFVRDRSGLFWSFFFPIFFILIFGSIFGRQDRKESGMKFTVGLVLEDASPAAAWVPDVFRKIPVLDVQQGSLKAETDSLRAGKRRAVIVFPADFGANLQAGQTSDVKIYFDPTQQQTAQIVTSLLHKVLDEMDRRMTGQPQLIRAHEEEMAPGGSSKEKDAAKPRGIDFLLPGILAMTIMQIGLFTAIPIITMREKGILKRLRATPLPRAAIVSSVVTQRLVISFVQTATIVALGVLLYKFRVQGAWPALLGLVILGVLTFICIGAVLSAVAKTQESGVSMVQLVNFPMMFLSGLFIPLEIIPRSLQPIVKILPATYLADALRHVMLAAPSAHSMTVNVAVMGAWLIGGLILAARTFRWE